MRTPAQHALSLDQVDSRPSTQRPAELSEWIERLALRDLFAASPSSVRALGLQVERRGALLVFSAPGVDHLMLNRVFVGPGVPSATALGRVTARMHARGVRRYFVHVARGKERDALAAALAARGLAPYPRSWVKLARGPLPVPEPSCELELRAARLHEADAFAEIVGRCFEMPDSVAELVAALVQRPRWHVHLAYDSGRPVAASALFVQGDVGYLGYGSTLPAYRGRGAQRALLAKRLRVAYALGCRLVLSETGEAVAGQRNPSFENMRALGMEPIAVRDNFTPAGVRWP